MLSTLLMTTVIPALLPAVGDGIRGLISWATGGSGAKPQNVDEVIRLMEADTNRLGKLAELEGQGQTYPWVEAIRKLQRPLVSMVILVAWVFVVALGYGDDFKADIVSNLANTVIFYLFGERAYMNIRAQPAAKH